MELVTTWWPAALAFLVCLVLAWVVALLTGMVLDDEVGDGALAIVLWVVMIGPPIIAAVVVGPSPDPPTALVGVLAVVAGLGAFLLPVVYLADRYLGPAWKGTRTGRGSGSPSLSRSGRRSPRSSFSAGGFPPPSA